MMAEEVLMKKLWKDRVRRVRSLNNLSQEELARKLGASVHLVKAWEQRATRPHSAIAERFCDLEKTVVGRLNPWMS
jgi:DNA-binding transcriptional regulator YiaG